ncbi:LIM-domain binding protein-domain-containing protein [Mycena metata]|uniref:LIM-domain binding protein-domain-containing protein n=1 Tax=Mycena metata TaxID=1033252 RepID=A0AAD7HTE0_9AGAR|nr:LIM-domain binding protein-domain-containing protein [Mycena metata]
MSAYPHTDAQEFAASDLDHSYMNPMLRQASAPSMIGLNNPAFMQPQQAGPPHHMGLNPGPNGANPPMGMLQGAPDMRFPPGHNPMMPRTMSMRPGARLPMNPAGLPPGMPMGGLTHNPQMQGGMAFSPNMMPAPSGMVRRVASNPSLNPGLGLSGQMMQQQQLQRQQHQQIQQMQHARQQQHQHQQQQQREMELAMMNRQPSNAQNAALARSASASGQLMHSLSQPASLGQPPHPGGMPPNGFQNQIVPPPQSNSPRARTPVMSMQSGPSQPPMGRAHMSDEMFFPNQYPQRPMGNGQFPFGTSPTPPLNMSDSFPPSVGTPRTAAFPPTPAQQLLQQHGGGGAENGGYPFIAPQRPLSHNNQHPSMQPQHAHSPPGQPPQHHSPHHSDPTHSHPPRPQSQPQPQPPGRPLSGAGPSHTPGPRPSQQLPNNPGLLPPGRIPPQQPSSQPNPNQNPNLRPQSSGGPHQQPIAPRPPPGSQPQLSGPVPPPPTGSDGTLVSASASPPDGNALLAAAANHAIPRPPAMTAQTFAIGYGQGLLRVMQFSGLLGSDTPQVQSQKLNLSYWDNLIRELTLWRDSLKNEAKPFEIGVPILPRFFLVTTQSGVKSMSFTLDGARERLSMPGHAIVECVTAVWTCRYNNGHIVTLRGPLTVHLVICSPGPQQAGAAQQNGGGAPPYVLKFDDFEFDAHSHDKYIALEAIAGPRKAEESAQTMNGAAAAAGDDDKKWEEPRLLIENGSIPGEPVNAFGIPQATMRCLELAESVGQMAELISFAKDQDVGPLTALKSFADKIREEQPGLTMMNGFGTNPYFQGSSMPSAQGNTLYSSAPPSVTNPACRAGQGPSSSMSSPQNAPPSAHNSPQKQHKTIPGKGTASTPSTSTASTGVGSNLNTPAMASAPLKRKAGATDTPTAATEPPPKRTTRRRRTTGGGG